MFCPEYLPNFLIISKLLEMSVRNIWKWQDTKIKIEKKKKKKKKNLIASFIICFDSLLSSNRHFYFVILLV